MTQFELVAVVLVAVLGGVLCTLLVQAAAAVRGLSQDVRETSRRLASLSEEVRPIVKRVERLSRPLEESTDDVRRVALAFHELSCSAERISDGVSRAVTWGTVLAPVITVGVERLRAWQAQASETEPPGPDARETAGNPAQEPSNGLDPVN